MITWGPATERAVVERASLPVQEATEEERTRKSVLRVLHARDTDALPPTSFQLSRPAARHNMTSGVVGEEVPVFTAPAGLIQGLGLSKKQ